LDSKTVIPDGADVIPETRHSKCEYTIAHTALQPKVSDKNSVVTLFKAMDTCVEMISIGLTQEVLDEFPDNGMQQHVEGKLSVVNLDRVHHQNIISDPSATSRILEAIKLAHFQSLQVNK